MNFGQAIEAVKQGKRAARAGWNGKGMFITLNKGSATIDNIVSGVNRPVGENAWAKLIGGVKTELFETGDQDTVTRMPNLNMKAADGAIVTGWLASQTDMLAEDWEISS